MEENKIYLLNQIDLDKIVYSKVNEMNDKKLIHIHYEKVGQKLLFQTPQLLNIFDIQKNQYFNQLILPLHDCNLKVPMLIKFLKDLDLKIVNDAKKNKNEWFKNKSAIKYKSLIKNLYTSNSQSNHYTPSKDDEKYCENGLIKLKLTNGVKILQNGKEIDLNDIEKNNFMRLIVELYAVWISNDVFGIYLKPVMVEQIPNKVLNFIDEKEDITDVNYMETEANSEDEYLDNNDLMLVSKKMDNLNYKNNIKSNENNKNESEDSIENLKVDNNTKMFQFGLHNVNDDFFNRVKKDNKIVSILSELNSNNTKKKTGSLSDASSDIEDDIKEKLSPIEKKNEEVQKVNVVEKKRGSSINDIINDLKLSQQNEVDENEDDEEDEGDEDDEDEEDEEDEDDNEDDDESENENIGRQNYSETSDSNDIKIIKNQNNRNGNFAMKR
jgi:CRISPR/Cas system-associated endoribonuclease Cas2